MAAAVEIADTVQVMTVALTSETFDETIAEGTTVVDFWATWCGPCKMFSPVFEASSVKHPDVTFAKVDADASSDILARYGFRSIPTVAVFRDGELVTARAGAMPSAAFEEFLTEHGVA